MAFAESTTQVCDFARSAIRWRTDTTKMTTLTLSRPAPTTLNNVRMPLECLITLSRHQKETVFGLGASCKTEQVYVERDVWMEPNADMCAVLGGGEFLIIKRWDKVDKGVMLYPLTLGPQPERQVVDPAVAFETHALSIRRRPARRLDAIEEILDVLAGDREVVSRTSFAIKGGEATVEYPVKTVNSSERHRYYQVDTGPVLFFGEPTGPHEIEHLHLAYVAHLGGDWAEFLVSRHTPLEGHSVAVHHFGRVCRVAARNSLWVVE